MPSLARVHLSNFLNIPESKIRVIKPYVGCGFGGKTELSAHQIAAALLAAKTGCPVKICLTREEEIACTRIRAPMSVYVKTGVRKDGLLMAQHIRCIADGGAYASTSVLLIYNSGLTCLIPYRIQNIVYEGNGLYE
jgi:4-hydroxybenzoyl-CoA reductase subunit alpha